MGFLRALGVTLLLTGCGNGILYPQFTASVSTPTPAPSSTPAIYSAAWVSGATTVNHNGVYGTLGTAAAGNIPGSRDSSVTWYDPAGNIWLFGGYGYDSVGTVALLNDLWKFQISTGLWTWMAGSNIANQNGVSGTQGTASTANIPGSRYTAASWTDGSGNFWLFGGTGYDNGSSYTTLNDLWKFSPGTLQWTFVSGSAVTGGTATYGTLGTGSTANIPGPRHSSTTWADTNGNLWIFGGSGNDSTGSGGYLNDLWKFQISTGKWTWVSGSNTISHGGVYGTQNQGSIANVPGTRDSASSWIDTSGNLYVFGGYGLDGTASSGTLNDLWKFEPATGKWTWLTGANTSGQGGTYGVLGVGASANTPGARQHGNGLTDSAGNFILTGGLGLDSVASNGVLNDVWIYRPSTGLWSWVFGSDINDASGVFGTQNISSVNNHPGARRVGTSCLDNSGNLWTFGGTALDSTGAGGYMNDLWRISH